MRCCETRGAAVVLAVLGAGLLGCGSDPAESTGAALTSPPASEREGSNQPPRIDRIWLAPDPPRPGQRLQANVETHDPDGDPVQHRFVWTVGGRVVHEGSSASWTPERLAKGERVEVTAVASDGLLESPPLSASARVGNRAPFVSGVRIEPPEAQPGVVLRAVVEASDPDSDRLDYEYRWLVNDSERSARGPTLDTAGLHRDDRVRVQVTARDREAHSRAVSSPELRMANSPPRIAGVPTPVERERGVFEYRFEASDPDGDRNLRFRVEEAPQGFWLDPLLGIARFKPDASESGEHPVAIEVRDGHGDGTTLRFNLRVASVDETPPAASAP